MDQMSEKQLVTLIKDLEKQFNPIRDQYYSLRKQITDANDFLEKIKIDKTKQMIKEKDLKNLWTVVLTLYPETKMEITRCIGLFLSKENAENHMNTMLERSSRFAHKLHVDNVPIPDDWNGEESTNVAVHKEFN